MLLLCCNIAVAQLQANFTSSTSVGCAPTVVQFKDASTGSPASWRWNLGNGNISTQQNPGTIYTKPGVYTVTLVIKDSTGQDSSIKVGYVTARAKPGVDFSFTPSSGCVPLPVQFTDATTDSAATETQWAWDFGDGQVSSSQNPTHTYSTVDNFSVSLTVTDNFGCSSFLQKQSVINANGIINADFQYSYANVCSPPTAVTFTNSSSSNSPIIFQWNFGDGGTSTAQNPVYSYKANGKFNIQLIASTNNGCRDTVTKSISIGTVTPNFTMPSGSCINKQVSFADSSQPTPISLSWSFGDGGLATGSVVSHAYASAGSYPVKLVANFGACTDSITKNFTVTSNPIAGFTSSGNRNSCQLPGIVQFQNTSVNAVTYSWSFGDGQTSTLASPLHNYTKAGFYDVTLVATNQNGCSNTIIQHKYVQLGPPRIDSLIGSPYEGCVPVAINFQSAVSSGDPVTGYTWDFGDNSPVSSAQLPSHTYSTAGTYNVKLTVTTSTGCSSSTTFSQAVIVGNKPVVNFTATPTTGCASVPIQFTDESTGAVTQWVWQFGDKGTSNIENPLYKYTDTGFFSVTLKVFSNGCTNSLTLNNYIYLKAPIAKFGVAQQCKNKLGRNFTDSSIGAKTWAWDFGDGHTSNQKSPSYVYAKGGNYIVNLTVTNGTCSDTYADTITVLNQNPSFTYSPKNTLVCKYNAVKFTAENYDTTSQSSFYWNFGDGTTLQLPAKTPTVQHVYKNDGNFIPYLVVRDNTGCNDTVTQAGVKFTVLGPVAAFTNTAGTCVNGQIKFTDNSVQDSTFKLQTWIWNYGDGKTDTLNGPPFTHVYDLAGTFKVQLKVIDSYGCSDSIIKNNADTITSPLAVFSLPDSANCPGSKVSFVNSSNGISLAYVWSFGDGTTSTLAAPNHQYNQLGTYTVALSIKDKFGCKDTLTRNNYVNVAKPLAQFTVDDTFGVCPPLIIHPQSTSTDYTFLTWDFGDGNSSNLTNPTHYYTGGGVYTLQLIVQGHGGCYDTASKQITLHGPGGKLSYTPMVLCNKDTVTLAVRGRSISTYEWDLGDGFTETSTTDSILRHPYTPGNYLPKVVIGDATGICTVTLQNASDTIKVGGVTARFTYQAAAGCDSALVLFTDSSAILFDTLKSRTWNFDDGTTSSVADPTHYYHSTVNKEISLKITTGFGCTSTVSLPLAVTVHQSPIITATIPASVCVGTKANFAAANSSVPPGTISWLWQLGDGGTAQQQDTAYIYKTGNTYTAVVTATNEFGCADTAQGNITVNSLPVTNAGNDTAICLGQNVLMQPTGASTYVWASNPTLSCTNCTNSLAAPDSTTMYYVTGETAAGCALEDSILVTVNRPFILQLAVIDTLCTGHPIQLTASGAEQYNWQPSTGLSSTTIANPIADPASATTYSVIASDTKKCFSDTASVVVIVFAPPTVSITNANVTILAGANILPLSQTSADVTRYQWSPLIGLSCNACAQPTLSPNETVRYTETVFNQYGCFDTANITVTVLCDNNSLFVPNTFSPKGNTNNRYFYPRGVGIYSIKSMRVFNRWGQPVFEKLSFLANDQNSGWDGTFKGQDLPTDVYVYVIEVICTNSTILTVKGDITLLR